MRKNYFAPNLKQSLIIILLLFLGSLIPGFIIFFFGENYPGWLNLIITPLSYSLVLVYFLAGSKNSEGNNSLNKQQTYLKINDPYFGKINPILFFIISLLAFLALSLFLEPLLSWIKAPEWYKEAMEQMMDNHIIIVIISVAIYAALFEEFMCRALILRGLLRNYSPFLAIITSSFLFAFLHFNFYQGVPAFIMGCLLGWLYYKTRSIWLVIFIHFSNNLVSIIMERYLPEQYVDSATWDLMPMKFYIPLYIISIAILFFSIYYINKNIKAHDYKKTIPDEVRSDIQGDDMGRGDMES